MKISNQKIKRLLRLTILSMAVLAIADALLAQVNGSLGDFFTGYSVIIFPTFIFSVYAVLGPPVFYFDGETEVLHIKSHLVFSRMIGKELYVVRQNLVSMQVDSSGIRKKLHIKYMKGGKEFLETFSISLVGKAQLDKLMAYAEGVEQEIIQRDERHLFI
jgi:hypothetical protein